MKIYITFGQTHTHSINSKTLDKDCVAIIEAESVKEGRQIAFDTFGDKWSFQYTDKTFNMKWMDRFYHRGFIKVN